MMDWLWRAAGILREDGARAFAWRVVAHTPYRHVLLTAFDPSRDPIPEAVSPLQLEVRRLDRGELEDWVDFRGVSQEEALWRVEIGHECWVALHEGRIVSATWLISDRVWIDELDGYLRLPPGAQYWYDSYTPPELRGRNIATVRAIEITRHFRDKGVTRSLATIRPENPAGARANDKAGYYRVGLLGCVRLGRFRLRFQVLEGDRPRFKRHRVPAVRDLSGVSRHHRHTSRVTRAA